MRFIESDDSLSLRGAQVMEAIATDKKQNLIPFFVSISTVKYRIDTRSTDWVTVSLQYEVLDSTI